MTTTTDEEVKRLLEMLFEIEARLRFIEEHSMPPYMVRECREYGKNAAKEARITVCKKEQR